MDSFSFRIRLRWKLQIKTGICAHLSLLHLRHLLCFSFDVQKPRGHHCTYSTQHTLPWVYIYYHKYQNISHKMRRLLSILMTTLLFIFLDPLMCLLKSTNAALTRLAVLLVRSAIATVIEKVALEPGRDAALVTAGELRLPTRPWSSGHHLCFSTHSVSWRATRTDDITQARSNIYVQMYFFQLQKIEPIIL